MHIVIVTSEFPPQPGGIGNHAYHLALFLFKNGYQVQVIADQRSQDNSQEILFDKSLPFQVARIKLQNWRLFMYFQRIITTFKFVKKADYVIATGKFSLWNVAFCTFFLKRNTMAVVHGSEVNFKPYILRKSIDVSLKKFKTIVAVSTYTKNLIPHIVGNIVVIPNGIDLSKWEPPKKHTIELIGEPTLTTVGRVSLRKGQLEVIKHLPELIKSYPKLHYHCIGIPAEAAAFAVVAKTLNVDTHVTFHGAVNDDDLKLMLKATDIFIMLSTEDQSGDVEGFGIAILEANALGIPSIGSKGCGIEDAIQEGVSGFLIEGKNISAFKAGIYNILYDKHKFEENAKSWAQLHDWNNIIKRYIDLMR